MSSKYEFIDGEKANYPIVLMCRWALVSRSGFYEWSGRPASATAQRRGALAVRVREVFEFSDSTYGYRRVHEELARRGVEIGPELVRQLMAEMDFVTWEGWLYLATVIDLHTKEVCGWAMADHMRTGPGVRRVLLVDRRSSPYLYHTYVRTRCHGTPHIMTVSHSSAAFAAGTTTKIVTMTAAKLHCHDCWDHSTAGPWCAAGLAATGSYELDQVRQIASALVRRQRAAQSRHRLLLRDLSATMT